MGRQDGRGRADLPGSTNVVAITPDNFTVTAMDWNAAPELIAVDIVSNEEVARLALSQPGSELVFSSDGRFAYLADWNADIVVVNAETWTVADRLDEGPARCVERQILRYRRRRFLRFGRDRRRAMRF